METIKLSEVLSRFNKTEGLATDGIIVSRNGKTFRTQARDLSQATTSQAGIMGVADKTYLETLKPWLRGSLGSFATSDAFNIYLDGLSYDSLKSGRYIVYLGGVPLFVTFSLLSAKEQISAVWIEGSLMVRKNAIGSNTGEGVTIAYRYYKKGAWGVWKTIYDDVRTDIPTAQTSANGTSENYIYSTGTDADKDCVASCNWWIYSENGRVYVRWKRWGADNNTHYDHDNEEHQTSQYMIPYMGSDGGACYQDGLLPWQWGQRMKDCGEKFRFIREELSTAEYVNLRYLNFANGGAYDTPISKATSAKAGVMSAEDKTKLDNLTAYARDLGNFESEEAALDALKDIEISSNSKIVHVHCTYANGAMSITMMQNVENDYTRQIIFNKSKVYQRAIYFTNSTRQEISYAEDWGFLFGDRLHWDSSKRKYLLSQFGDTFNSDYTDEIPLATSSNDGLMSAAQAEKIKSLEDRIAALEAKIK